MFDNYLQRIKRYKVLTESLTLFELKIPCSKVEMLTIILSMSKNNQSLKYLYRPPHYALCCISLYKPFEISKLFW